MNNDGCYYDKIVRKNEKWSLQSRTDVMQKQCY